MENLFTIIEKSTAEEVYLFGSYLKKNMPNDIDLLIVYDTMRCSIDEALELRTLLSEVIKKTFGLAAHIVLLTISEEKELHFIKSEGCVPFLSKFSEIII